MSKNKITGDKKHTEKIRIEYAKKNNKLIETINSLKTLNNGLECKLKDIELSIKTKDLILKQKEELVNLLLKKLGWDESDAVRTLYPVEHFNKMLGLIYNSLGYSNFILKEDDNIESLTESYLKLNDLIHNLY